MSSGLSPAALIISKLELQSPTGPQILEPVVGWLATLTFGLASLNLKKLRWGRTYEQTNKIKRGRRTYKQANELLYIRTNKLIKGRGRTYKRWGDGILSVRKVTTYTHTH